MTYGDNCGFRDQLTSQHGSDTDAVVTILKPQTMKVCNTPIVLYVVLQPAASGPHGRYHEPSNRHIFLEWIMSVMFQRNAFLVALSKEKPYGAKIHKIHDKGHGRHWRGLSNLGNPPPTIREFWRPGLGFSDPARPTVVMAADTWRRPWCLALG